LSRSIISKFDFWHLFVLIMEGARVAAIFGVLIATLTIVINFVVIPAFFNRLDQMQERFRNQMNLYKVHTHIFIYAKIENKFTMTRFLH